MRNAIMAAMVLTLATLAQAGGHWRFERTYVDGDDTKTPDASGNGNHGTLVNGPTLTAGRTGRGMQFVAASEQYVTFPGTMLTDDIDGAAAVTIAVWVKQATSAGTQRVIALPVRLSVFGASVSMVDGVAQTGGRSISTDSFQSVEATAAVTADTWAHVVGVMNYAAKTIQLYVDGRWVAGASDVAFGSNVFTPSSTEPPHRSNIGCSILFAQFFNGTIDDVIIADFAWTAEEVRAYYHSGEVPSRRAE